MATKWRTGASRAEASSSPDACVDVACALDDAPKRWRGMALGASTTGTHCRLDLSTANVSDCGISIRMPKSARCSYTASGAPALASSRFNRRSAAHSEGIQPVIEKMMISKYSERCENPKVHNTTSQYSYKQILVIPATE